MQFCCQTCGSDAQWLAGTYCSCAILVKILIVPRARMFNQRSQGHDEMESQSPSADHQSFVFQCAHCGTKYGKKPKPCDSNVRAENWAFAAEAQLRWPKAYLLCSPSHMVEAFLMHLLRRAVPEACCKTKTPPTRGRPRNCEFPYFALHIPKKRQESRSSSCSALQVKFNQHTHVATPQSNR